MFMFFECQAQDPILHNILVPETLNPGFTGFMENLCRNSS
jgi:hypothetical protein